LAWAKQQLTWLWQQVFPEPLIPPVIVIPPRSIWSVNDWCCAQSDHPLGRLIADLQQGQWRRREQAVRLLGGLNDHRAVRILLKVIQADSSQTVRTAAGEALISYGTEAAGALVQALDSEYTWDEPAYRAELLAILLQFGTSAVGPLIDALTHRDWRMRDTAAELLGLLGAPQAVEPLSALLEQEHNRAVQQTVKDALRRIGGTS
jgi:HEAT repeat protein